MKSKWVKGFFAGAAAYCLAVGLWWRFLLLPEVDREFPHRLTDPITLGSLRMREHALFGPLKDAAALGLVLTYAYVFVALLLLAFKRRNGTGEGRNEK